MARIVGACQDEEFVQDLFFNSTDVVLRREENWQHELAKKHHKHHLLVRTL